jgi:hypothetical protein
MNVVDDCQKSGLNTIRQGDIVVKIGAGKKDVVLPLPTGEVSPNIAMNFAPRKPRVSMTGSPIPGTEKLFEIGSASYNTENTRAVAVCIITTALML